MSTEMGAWYQSAGDMCNEFMAWSPRRGGEGVVVRDSSSLSCPMACALSGSGLYRAVHLFSPEQLVGKVLFIFARLLWSLVFKGKGQGNGCFSCNVCIPMNLQAWGAVLQLFQTCLWILQLWLSLKELSYETKPSLGLVTHGQCRKAWLCWRALLGN